MERITAWLLTVDESKLYQQVDSSFGTIDRTLQHIQAAQVYWHAILIEGQINAFDQPLKENAVREVMADLITGAQAFVTHLAALSEQQLIEKIDVGDSTQSRYEYILHIVNHTSYHRGQVVTLCRTLGITGEIPVTDYDAYLWWIENN